MRLRFSDLQVLRKIAKDEVEKGLGKLKNWWTHKYQLPATHTLFTDRSVASLNIEMFSDLYIKRDDLQREFENATGKEANLLAKQINEIDSILEDTEYTDDPLIDKWEKELMEGKIPDLTEKMV